MQFVVKMCKLLFAKTFFRRDASSNKIIIDAEISSLATIDSFNATALQAALRAALDTVVNDGMIGRYDSDTSAPIHIGLPATGCVKCSCN